MKVIHQNQQIKKIHKSLNPQESHGEYIGLAKFSQKNKNNLIKATEEMLAHDDSLYYEDALQKAIDNDLLMHAASTNGLPCMEIDTPEDLTNAKQLISQICQ
jgi:choline kinase